MLPCLATFPIPVKTVPPQQNLYAPVVVLNRTDAPQPADSSCALALKTVTEKLQFAGPDVHVTVVVPAGKAVPDAGVQTIAPQVPLVVGAG